MNLLVAHPVFAGTFTAQVDRTRIAEGEPVTLDLTASGEDGSPDLGPLGADFDIVGRSQSSRFNIINGRSSSSRQWRLILMPKRGGELTIPAIRLGGLESDPIIIEVSPPDEAPTGAAAANQPVLLEVETDTRQPYVQGQVVYRVRVLSRGPLREASLSQPDAGDAILEQLGDDKEFTTNRNGVTYQVVERRYAIFPQHSGEVKIEGPVLTAAVPVQGGHRRSLRDRFFGGDPFADFGNFFGRGPGVGGLFEDTRPVRFRGRSITLDVRPQPAGTRGVWLPAKNLTLTESWSPEPPVFRVGEPVTRSVTLTAEGLSAAQLPDLTQPATPAFKRYPDQAQDDNRAQADDLVATRTRKTALVPTAPGKVTLPEIRIPWWDTVTQKTRVARLPARQVEVLPALAGTNAAPPVQTPAARTADTERPVPASKPTAKTAGTPGDTPAAAPALRSSYWPWVAGAATAAWLVTLLLWARTRRRHAGPDTPRGNNENVASPPPEPPAQSHTRLREACYANDLKAARAALLAWARTRWPESPPQGLRALAQQCKNERLRNGILEIDRLLYDAVAQRDWDGRAAWTVLERLFEGARREDEAKTDPVLPDLYPGHPG